MRTLYELNQLGSYQGMHEIRANITIRYFKDGTLGVHPVWGDYVLYSERYSVYKIDGEYWK